MTLLSIEHLDVDIDGRAILDNIHLAIERGEIVTIVGPNGSGKTTLLKAIIGSLTPAWGKLHRAPGLVMGMCRSAFTSTRRCR
ncbi:hemin import ATP-binding protein HmuV [Halomonas elongata]|uniref:Hemin import ATP-binding protein HmuV n=1 Tax=Halomonas elongata TaxID=2746 RepID=A0A1B8NXV7_HALEL|nr:ATP-binding cassette domain-containing protein [Halomonas elongata]OBX34846.1 hemin import ATP-binding protein HmuV [Halomonas elongata]